MTADEKWEAETSDRSMIAQLGWEERGLARKRRLYLVAMCRRFWNHMPTAASQEAIEVVELYVDGHLSLDELRTAHQAQSMAHLELCAPGKRVARTQRLHFSGCALNASDPARCYLLAAWNAAASRFGAHLLRDIFGNPFRPPSLDPGWRTSDVLGLATAIYEDRAFDRLPLLADALLDAGCGDEAIISHCQSPGPHVRGCWVLDLVLGRP